MWGIYFIGHFCISSGYSYFYLLLIICLDGWRPRPQKIVSLKLFHILLYLTFFTGWCAKSYFRDHENFYNRTMVAFFQKYEVTCRVSRQYHPKLMDKAYIAEVIQLKHTYGWGLGFYEHIFDEAYPSSCVWLSFLELSLLYFFLYVFVAMFSFNLCCFVGSFLFSL